MLSRKVLFLLHLQPLPQPDGRRLAASLCRDYAQIFSAGTAPALNPTAIVAVMLEAGVDISGHRSKQIDELAKEDFPFVITVSATRRAKPARFFPARFTSCNGVSMIRPQRPARKERN